MRDLLACLALGTTLTGCAAAPSPAPPEAPAQCRQAGLDGFVGEVASEQLEARIMAASGARTFRWVGPDTMTTMEFRADRVTVTVDASGRVTRVGCG